MFYESRVCRRQKQGGQQWPGLFRIEYAGAVYHVTGRGDSQDEFILMAQLESTGKSSLT